MMKASIDRCVLCLKIFNNENPDDKKTEEHVFPQSWHPDSSPENLEKWKVPSCHKCNREHGKVEQDLLLKLGLCVEPKDAKSSGIADKVLRSLNPGFGKNERDKKIRKSKREKIIKETAQLKDFPSHAILPNFGPHRESHLFKQMVVYVLEKDLKTVGTKLIRGLTFLLDNAFIENDYMIDIFFIKENLDVVNYIKAALTKFGSSQHCGPGIKVERAVAEDDSKSSLYRIEIWGKLRIYGLVSKKK